MIKYLKLYISSSDNPYINLATEKYLFDNLAKDCILLYLWQNFNTVVIGKNQNAFTECNLSLMDRENVSLARRMSGGGAVYHDLGNLNYTFICSTANYDLDSQFKIICNACKSLGIDAQISGRNDLVVNEKKFSGSAFYNSCEKSLHHGTLLINSDFEKLSKYLTPSELKLKSKGVKSVKSRVVNLSEISDEISCDIMKSKLIDSFENYYNLKAKLIPEIDYENIEKNYKTFSDRSNQVSTSIPYTLSLSKRFDWGCLEVQLLIKSNKIEQIKVYSDSLDYSFPTKLESTLTGLDFDPNKLKIALSNTFDSKLSDEISDMFKI